MMKRPWGIKVVVFLQILMIIGIIFMSLMLMIGMQMFMPLPIQITGFLAIVLGLFFLIMVSIITVLTYLLWRGSEWVWYIYVAFTIFSLLGSIVSLQFISVGLQIFILLALTHKDTISFIDPRLIKWMGWDLETD